MYVKTLAHISLWFLVYLTSCELCAGFDIDDVCALLLGCQFLNANFWCSVINGEN